MGLGIHALDLLRWLVGQEIVAVTAMADGPSDAYPVEFLLATGAPFAASGADGLRSVAATVVILEAAASGQTVAVDRAGRPA